MHFLLQPIDNQRFLKIIAINVGTPVSPAARWPRRVGLGGVGRSALLAPFYHFLRFGGSPAKSAHCPPI